MGKKFGKGWGDRVLGAMKVLNKVAEKQEYDSTHTVDAYKINKGMKVFDIEDPSVRWTISDIEDEITIKKRSVTLKLKGREDIKRHPTKLFFGQRKAIDACIRDIQNTESVILKEMRENLNRLDAVNRVKQLNVLRKSIR